VFRDATTSSLRQRMKVLMMRFFGFFRSSASYRCRIAFNLKGLPYDFVPVNFRNDEQNAAAYRRINPQGFVPAVESDGRVLTQSLAIIEWLEEAFPSPALLPSDLLVRAEIRAFTMAIACDIHPLNNLRVLGHLRRHLECDESAVTEWYRHWTEVGLMACEELLERRDGRPEFCFGSEPSIADLCLVPQLYNARRFECDLDMMPRLVGIEAVCAQLPAFAAAHPDLQPDAVR